MSLIIETDKVFNDIIFIIAVLLILAAIVIAWGLIVQAVHHFWKDQNYWYVYMCCTLGTFTFAWCMLILFTIFLEIGWITIA